MGNGFQCVQQRRTPKGIKTDRAVAMWHFTIGRIQKSKILKMYFITLSVNYSF